MSNWGIEIEPRLFRLARAFAEKSTKYGFTHINPEQRKDRCFADQLTGQLGELGTIAQLCGSSRPYIEAQNFANENKTDYGADLLGLNLDIKTTRVLYGAPPEKFNLLVASRDLRDSWVYVQSLVYNLDEEKEYALVCPVGWTTGAKLRKHTHTDSQFASEYKMGVSALSPLPPFRWPQIPYKSLQIRAKGAPAPNLYAKIQG